MSGTAANPSPFDPLESMPPDEPRFVLRGKDPDAPPTITEWCRLRRNRAMHRFNKLERPSEQDRLALKATLEQCREAEEVAMNIRDWQTGHQTPEHDRASYNDIARSQEQLAEAARRRRLESLLTHVQEGRYHVCEFRDGLADMGLIGEMVITEIQSTLDRLQQIADEHDPRSERYRPQPALPLGSPAA